MIPRTPSSPPTEPLFPYTTLCRSHFHAALLRLFGRRAAEGHDDQAQHGCEQHRHQDDIAVHVPARFPSGSIKVDAPPSGGTPRPVQAEALSLRREGIMLLRSLILLSRESPFFDAVGRPSSASASSAAPTTASIRRSEEHTYELKSLMRISYAVFCL